MKLEIEITDEEIKSAVERKVRTAIADQTNQWNVDVYIKKQVHDKWQSIVGIMVEDMLADSPKMKQKIVDAIQAKLKGQVTALMKVTK